MLSADSVVHLCCFQAEDGIRDYKVTGVQTCALPITITSDISLLSLKHDIFPLKGPIGTVAMEVQWQYIGPSQVRRRTGCAGFAESCPSILRLESQPDYFRKLRSRL